MWKWKFELIFFKEQEVYLDNPVVFKRFPVYGYYNEVGFLTFAIYDNEKWKSNLEEGLYTNANHLIAYRKHTPLNAGKK